ncbi:MAG: putative paraquat-inducible protein A [Rhodobacteraceae bacterium HLUCCA08]|nr:MAG: putative paraquat-inducible protein A [Rhodobacteraceae bacterium HLUCCA08]
MTLRILNLALLVLFPIAWFAPLLRAAMLPIFGLNEISIISGLQSLWGTDVFLALVVTAFAIFAPYLKTIGLALVQFRLLDARTLPWLSYLGKLAMADIFLIALYVVVVKGVSRTHVEGAWGLYLFTACVLASIAISIAMARQGGLSDPRRAAGAPPPEDIRHPKTQGH